MIPAEALESEPTNRKRVILVVDDEIGIREFLAAYLQSKDFKIFTAASTEQALGLWPEIREMVDLLITDIVMPGANGTILAQKLRGEKPSLQVIYMSGYIPEEIAGDALADRFFRKPFHPQDLLAAVRDLLQQA